LEFPAELHDLKAVYDVIYKLRLANGFKKSYINFGLLLNRQLQTPVLSLIADDDEADFACTAADGAISRLKCRCGDLVITHENGKTQIQPLMPEDALDNDTLVSVEALRQALPTVAIADRDAVWDANLHAIALQEWRLFSGSDESVLGLGSFDPPDDEAEWELMAGS
jgi:hypothetical protein